MMTDDPGLAAPLAILAILLAATALEYAIRWYRHRRDVWRRYRIVKARATR